MAAAPISGAARLWAATTAVLAFFLILTVALAFQVRDSGGVDFDATPAAEARRATVQVALTEFSITPGEIVVPAGQPVRFEIANTGTVPHDLAIEDVAASEQIAGGEATVLELDPLPAGTYRLLCTVAGHDAAGMTGTLRVVDDRDTAAVSQPGGDADDPGTGRGHADGRGHGGMSAEEMAAQHDDLSAFPADTAGQGNQPLEPELAPDGAKVFELTATELDWEVEPGVVRPALAFNGQVPGPRIDVDLGDRVRIVLRNELSVPTALHLHGLVLPNEMDGVPGLTQDSVLPGGSFTYEFTVRNAGSHMYHSHFDSANQVPSGLLGAFVVHDPADPQVDHDYVMILNDGPLGYTLNGKGFPATAPLVVAEGETVRIRYMNEGLQIHPMHLHGMPQRVIARDGYPLTTPVLEDNVLVSPGDRVDVIVDATEPGAWAWHCHILSHAEGPEGMFGMVTALIVE